MKPRWRKVWADLWGNRSRTLAVVASIAVGVFVIGVIGGVYFMLNEDLNRSYAQANPANINLITSPFDNEMVDILSRMDHVQRAEGYRSFTLRLRTSPDTWDNIEVKAFADDEPRRIFRLIAPVGARMPGDHEIILEEKTLAELGLAIGDRILVELDDGTRRQLTVVGYGVDQSNIIDTILGNYRGYVNCTTGQWLHQPADMNRLYLTVAGDREDEKHVRDVAAEVTDRLERANLWVYRTQTNAQSEHPLDAIVDALAMVLIIMGVLTLFLSGSLISNTMSALLTHHARQIGVIKLIGGRRGQIIAMYLTLILAYSLIALLIGIPLGSAGAYYLQEYVAGVVNFVTLGFRIVPQAIAFQIAVGLLAPPLAGLLPVLRGSRISVQDALTSTGLADSDAKKGLIDRLIGRIKRLSRTWLIALRNTFRSKSRLILTLLTLTLSGAIFIAVFNTQVALNTKMEQVASYFGADVQLDFAQSYRIERIEHELSRFANIQYVETWAITGGEIVASDQGPAIPFNLMAPPADSPLVEPTLIAGRWLLPGDQRAIAVNESFWDDYPDLEPGDTLRIKVAGTEEDWTVVGIFQFAALGQMFGYANGDYVADLMGEQYHSAHYRIMTDDHSLSLQKRLASELNNYFQDRNYQVSGVDAGAELYTSTTDVLGILTTVLLALSLMTALVGSIGLAGTMSMNVMERTREIGVMRAIGAHNRIVSQLVIIEGLLIGLISYGLGAILSFPITTLLSNVIMQAIFNIPAEPSLDPQGFAIWLAVVLALSAVASLVPARNATRLTIREVLAYE